MSRLTHAALFNQSEFDRSLPSGNDHLAVSKHYSEFLEQGRNLLLEYHLEGGTSSTLVKNYSWLIDQLLKNCWKFHFADQGSKVSASLVAVGGYGRNELNLGSDIDILILLPEKAPGTVQDCAEALVRMCWDIGLKIGHSIRTVSQCISMAKDDITVMTNLMEARPLVDETNLCDELTTRLRHPRVWPTGKYFKFKLEEQVSRHAHFADTANNLEPNLKESPGGLRDIHMISWVANRYFGTSNLDELVEHGFLSQSEFNSLIKGRNFLWRLRNGLYCLAGRSEDRLLFDYQADLAIQLGFEEGENHLAVELMMKRYYRTVKEIQLLNELLLQHFQEVILVKRKPKVRQINRRFQSVGEFVETRHEKVFQQSPMALLEIFYILQTHPKLKGVRASTIRQLRDHLQLIDDQYRKDLANRSLFLEIFKQQDGLTHALRRMNNYGVLGRFFPEFGKIVGQMQHDLFHVYTVDAHSLFVVRNLRRLMIPEHGHEFPLLTKLLGRQNKRERLYLAALCHDIGKGSGRDHSEVGEEIAYKLCQNLEMSEYDSQFVAWLIRHHLVMSWTAQREDISDPRVIDRFAEVVGDQERLDSLYLLTFADIRGTSPKVWNEWKGQLLANLFTATSRRLRSGLSSAATVKERIEARKQEIRKLVKGKVSDPSLDSLWGVLDEEYFLRNGPETSAWHAMQISKANLLDIPLVRLRYRSEIKALQILVMCPDSEDVLLNITGGLDKLHFNIMDARIHQTTSGMTLLVFIAADTHGNGAHKKWLDQNAQQLREFLLTSPEQYRPAERILPRTLKQFHVPTEVSFSESEHKTHTTMEVISQDRPGLLFHVAKALNECKVRLISAKVSTVGEKAEDTFFITDRDGNPVTEKAALDELEEKIKRYLTVISANS